MTWSRRIELVCGLLAGVLGPLTLGLALFLPSGVTSTGMHESLVEVEGLANLSGAILLFGTLLLGIAVFAALHSLTGVSRWLTLLWVWVVLLDGAMFLAFLTIGLYFVPTLALALAAAIAGSACTRERMPAHQI
jgi:hypothetical protein